MNAAPRRLFLRLPEDRTQGPESQLPPGTLRALPVPAELADRVAHLLAYREAFAPGETVLEQVLPDGAVRLVIPLDGGQPWVLGAHAQPATVPLTGRIDGWSLTLQPAAATALLGVPAGAIGGAPLPLADLWGARATELHERLLAADGDAARLALLPRLLAARPVRGPDAERAARAVALIAAGAAPGVPALAAALDLGERRLQQLCRAQLGLPPRTLTRLERLRRLLRLRRNAPALGWAALAQEAGFFDQAHLGHELRLLAGLAPGELPAPVSGSSKIRAGRTATVAR